MPPVLRPGDAAAAPGALELTILMPCLNEAATLAVCIEKARRFLAETGTSGEVVVADNGSTDGSREIARRAGARVVEVERRGYGYALAGGIAAASGRYVIMGDADDSYDFTALSPFLAALRAGASLVVGNRFQGGIAPGAMPALHRYLGNPVLSFVGRRLFRTEIGDFHCGLRGMRRDDIVALGLKTTGMEFASEMIVRASLKGLPIAEVPTTLEPDGRPGRSHLRSWPDGWRHLVFMLLFCPRWLFLAPGLALIVFGLVFGVPTALGTVHVGRVAFDVDTLAVAAAALIVGVQAVQFALLAKVYGYEARIFGRPPVSGAQLRRFSIGRVILVSSLFIAAGLVGLAVSVLDWRHASFGALDTRRQIRLIIPSITGIVLGFQLIFGRFFLGFLGGELGDPAGT